MPAFASALEVQDTLPWGLSPQGRPLFSRDWAGVPMSLPQNGCYREGIRVDTREMYVPI